MENQEVQVQENQPILPNLKTVTFGGYDKKSVISYIYELSAESKDAHDRFQSQLEEVTQSREKLNITIREMEEKLKSAEKERSGISVELNCEKQRTGELGEMIESLNLQIARHERTLIDKDKEIANYRLANNELEQKNEVLESKKHEVEKASAYVGEILLRTKADSEKILSDASLKAHELVTEAGKSLENVHTQFEMFRSDISKLQFQIKDTIEAVQQKFADVGNAVDAAEKELRDIVYPMPTATLKLIQQEDTYITEDEDEFFSTAAQQ